MLTAISRYGVRAVPETNAIIRRCETRGELIDGPAIEQFERAFAARLGSGTAVATSYGRMAFFHIDAEFSDELLAKLPKPLELMR